MNLYAWTLNGYTCYTLSPNPSEGDQIYKADGTPYEQDEFEDDDSAFSPWIASTDGSTYITLYAVPL